MGGRGGGRVRQPRARQVLMLPLNATWEPQTRVQSETSAATRVRPAVACHARVHTHTHTHTHTCTHIHTCTCTRMRTMKEKRAMTGGISAPSPPLTARACTHTHPSHLHPPSSPCGNGRTARGRAAAPRRATATARAARRLLRAARRGVLAPPLAPRTGAAWGGRGAHAARSRYCSAARRWPGTLRRRPRRPAARAPRRARAGRRGGAWCVRGRSPRS